MSDRVSLRDYQEHALEALFAYWRGNGGNPLIEMATGTGKSLVIGEMARRLMVGTSRRILVVTHVRELIEQDEKAISGVARSADRRLLRRAQSSRIRCRPLPRQHPKPL
jgi:DNA repair protein RadD